MIEKAEIIDQPYSGEFEERVYDIENIWNSSDWTWIKFTNEDSYEWCGEFRGSPKDVSLSKKHETLLILTSDYLLLLDINTGNIIEFEDQPQYQSLTITPNEDFIIADYYNLEKITNSLKNKSLIISPIKMDIIEFKSWNNSKLEFICDEFLNWDRHFLMEYDANLDKIEIKKQL